jgi:hypothetical protein
MTEIFHTTEKCDAIFFRCVSSDVNSGAKCCPCSQEIGKESGQAQAKGLSRNKNNKMGVL